MGRKVNANAIRMGINKTWDSVWYSSKMEYPRMLAQDLKIKKYVSEKMKDAGIDSILLNRTTSKIEIDVYVARPGVAIGRGGEGIDLLQKELKRMIKMDVEVKIREVKKADISARIIARSIADGLRKKATK